MTHPVEGDGLMKRKVPLICWGAPVGLPCLAGMGTGLNLLRGASAVPIAFSFLELEDLVPKTIVLDNRNVLRHISGG